MRAGRRRSRLNIMICPNATRSAMSYRESQPARCPQAPVQSCDKYRDTRHASSGSDQGPAGPRFGPPPYFHPVTPDVPATTSLDRMSNQFHAGASMLVRHIVAGRGISEGQKLRSVTNSCSLEYLVPTSPGLERRCVPPVPAAFSPASSTVSPSVGAVVPDRWVSVVSVPPLPPLSCKEGVRVWCR